MLKHLHFPGGEVPAATSPAGFTGGSSGSETETSAPQPGITSICICPARAWTRRSSRPMPGASAASAPPPSSRTLIRRFSPSQSHCARTRRTSGCSIMASSSPRTIALAAWATSPGRALPFSGGSMNWTSMPLKRVSGRRSSRRRSKAVATGSSTRSVVRSLSVRSPTRALAVSSVTVERAAASSSEVSAGRPGLFPGWWSAGRPVPRSRGAARRTPPGIPAGTTAAHPPPSPGSSVRRHATGTAPGPAGLVPRIGRADGSVRTSRALLGAYFMARTGRSCAAISASPNQGASSERAARRRSSSGIETREMISSSPPSSAADPCSLR